MIVARLISSRHQNVVWLLPQVVQELLVSRLEDVLPIGWKACPLLGVVKSPIDKLVRRLAKPHRLVECVGDRPRLDLAQPLDAVLRSVNPVDARAILVLTWPG